MNCKVSWTSVLNSSSTYLNFKLYSFKPKFKHMFHTKFYVKCG